MVGDFESVKNDMKFAARFLDIYLYHLQTHRQVLAGGYTRSTRNNIYLPTKLEFVV